MVLRALAGGIVFAAGSVVCAVSAGAADLPLPAPAGTNRAGRLRARCDLQLDRLLHRRPCRCGLRQFVMERSAYRRGQQFQQHRISRRRAGRRQLSDRPVRARRRRRLELDRAQRQRQRFGRRCDQHQCALDLDRHRPRRRRVRPLSGVRQRRRRLRAGSERLHRHVRQQCEQQPDAHRLDRRRRTGIRKPKTGRRSSNTITWASARRA